MKPLKTQKPDVPSKKTAYNLFCKDIRKTKKELEGVSVSKASAIISKEWKKVKANEKKMKKYRNLYEEKKKRDEEALQRYQEDHVHEMEIVSLHNRCKKAKPATARQMKNEADDSQNEKTVAGRPAVRLPQKLRKSPESFDTDLDDSDDEQQRVVKKHQKAPKFPGFVNTDSSTENEQGTAVKHHQEPLKIPKFVDTDLDDSDDEQERINPTPPPPPQKKKNPGSIDTQRTGQAINKFPLRLAAPTSSHLA